MGDARVALVTGGGANVGRAIAHRLAVGGVGKVIVNDIDVGRAERVADELRSLGVKSEAHIADLTDYDAVVAMFEAAGGVDILVNNAGLPVEFATPKPFVRTTPDDWDPWLKISLYAVMYSVRSALPHMIERGWGRIITVISDAGRTGEPRLGAYGAAKAGAGALMRSVAKEVGRNGITCNNIALGTIRHGAAGLTEEQIDAMVRRYIVPRLGESDDPAGLVAFLASDEASWISGQTIAVNGGYTVTL